MLDFSHIKNPLHDTFKSIPCFPSINFILYNLLSTMEVIEVKPNYVKMSLDHKLVIISNGRMVLRTGFLTPVELKQAHRKYHAIINSRNNDRTN